MNYRSLTISLLLTATACAEPELREDPARGEADGIVGGTNASISDFPWQVSLQSSGGSHFCGGSILSDRWILTANHCVEGSSASSIRVGAGTSNRSAMASQGQIRAVERIVQFPGYRSPEYGKDAALLYLASPLSFSSSVAPIALATPQDRAAGLTDDGRSSTVTGWGTLRAGGRSPDTLQRVDVPIVSNERASSMYGETITDDQLAAGDTNDGGEDSCQGDSGGPLVVNKGSDKVLAGIVSWGNGCADAAYPGLYGRVSSFEGWIRGVMNGTPSTPSTGDNATVLLSNSGLSGARSSWRHFTVEVPAGASSFTATLSGGTGDADLFVRNGSRPTTSSYQCRSDGELNDELCTIERPAAGRWYVSVRGYARYSNASLQVVADTPAP